jgi:uncharacterized protein YjbK
MIEYKNKKAFEGVIHKSIEYSKEVERLPVKISLREEFGLDDKNIYKFIGSLVTQRVNFGDDSVIISLDTNYYLGKVDYELEIESEDTGKITAVANRLGLHPEVGGAGKYSRFRKKLLKMKSKI